MEDRNDRFGMPESAFRAARESHGLGNPTIRSGMYVPTRREVADGAPSWLYPVLIDWFWECPSELIPSDEQIQEVKAILTARPDVSDPVIASLLTECDDVLSSGKHEASAD